jgi:hypothetical protein
MRMKFLYLQANKGRREQKRGIPLTDT